MARIGFIGLGNMGLPMSLNLRKVGHSVAGFDVSAAAVEKLVAGAGTAADAIKGAASNVEAVISMLPSGREVREVYLKAGVLDAITPDTLLIDCSTIDVDSARQVSAAAREKGLAMLDAPVSGGVAGAQAATLTFMVGGTEQAFARAKPLLEAMGRSIDPARGGSGGALRALCRKRVRRPRLFRDHPLPARHVIRPSSGNGHEQLARVALCGLERHARHAASVDADRRQDTADADAVAEPFLARGAVRDRAWPDDLAHALSRTRVPDRFRLHRSRAVGADERWRFAPTPARADAGRPIPYRAVRGDDRARARRADHDDAVRDRRQHSVRSGPHPRRLRSRLRHAFLARVVLDASGADAFPHRISRQGEPGAFLLGQLRSGGHAVFRKAGAAPSRRRAASAGRGRTRSIFARGVERRLLAGWRRAGGICG